MFLEVGLKWACWLCAEIWIFKVKVSREIAQFSPCRIRTYATLTVALMAQYLNVRQRKLGTIIIQTVHILQHETAVTDSLPEEEFVHGHSNHFQMT
jgi:hypothetical protein